jgi:hypothetical protein
VGQPLRDYPLDPVDPVDLIECDSRRLQFDQEEEKYFEISFTGWSFSKGFEFSTSDCNLNSNQDKSYQ